MRRMKTIATQEVDDDMRNIRRYHWTMAYIASVLTAVLILQVLDGLDILS